MTKHMMLMTRPAIALSFLLSGSAAVSVPTRQAVPPVTELEVYVFTAGNCTFCKQPEFVNAVKRARGLFAARAANEGKSFSFRGVAQDTEVGRGLLALRELGDFDEVSIGCGDFNTANIYLRQLLRLELGERAGVPAIVIVERAIGTDSLQRSAGPAKYRAFVVGSLIPQWVEGGAKLPFFAVKDDTSLPK